MKGQMNPMIPHANKPPEIIELESIYGIELTEIDKLTWENTNTYTLTHDQQVNELNLSKNGITEIKGLDNFTALTTLYLMDNRITEIKNLDNLTSLEHLHLGQNLITEIINLDNLTSLEILVLNKNKINEIKNLEKLVNLLFLFLGGNLITEIKNLEHLTNLDRLSLWSNSISEIAHLEKLTSLTSLDLWNNSIYEIKNLETLTVLTDLDLAHNLITEIKNLEKLTALNKLNLSNNLITEIKNLEKLTTLVNLTNLLIDDNPFIDATGLKLNPDDNHLDAIRSYLQRQLETNKIEIILPAKVLLLGNHSSGKTTFLRYLLDGVISENASNSTHVLSIRHYPKDKLGQLPEAVLYDFGGQDYYHGVYRAFLTNDAINLIFWQQSTDNNSLSDDNSGRATLTQNFDRAYWIAQMKHFDEKTQLYLVQSHADEYKESHLIDTTLSKNITNEFFIALTLSPSESQKASLNYLTVSLNEQITNKRIKREEPQWYIDFLKYVSKSKSKDKTRLITIKKYYKRVNQDEELFRTELHQLSQQGLILYYRDIKELKDIAWLNPSETIAYIHSKILSSDNFKDTKGILPKKNFDIICDTYIRLMLLINKVIFYDETEEQYIIPGYLPRAKEDEDEFFYFFDFTTPNLVLKFEYFIPFGLINQLICAYGTLKELKKYWRDVLIFTTDAKQTKILIKLDFSKLEIKLYVVSNVPSAKKRIREIEGILLDDILAFYHDEINYRSKLLPPKEEKKENIERLDGNKKNEKYSKPRDLYISLDDEYFIHLPSLDDELITQDKILAYPRQENKLDKSNPTIKPSILYAHLTRNTRVKSMKKIFISYSREDVEYKNELKKHLNLLKIFDIADNWSCEQITPGLWNQQIQKELDDCDLIIYMLSVNFFTSQYILEHEVLKGMQQIAENKNKKIVNVIVSDFIGFDTINAVLHDNFNEQQKAILQLGDYQYLPYGTSQNRLTQKEKERIIPLVEQTSGTIDAAFTQITKKVAEALK